MTTSNGCSWVVCRGPVRHWLRLLAFPMRTSWHEATGQTLGPPGSRAKSFDTCQVLRPRRAAKPCDIVLGCVAFRLRNGVGTRDIRISRLNGWPMPSPTDASSEAIHSASSEIFRPLVGSTITPVVVFIPLAFLEGNNRRVFPLAGIDHGGFAAYLPGPCDDAYPLAGVLFHP
jgi:hypothetical protein